jgi:hypothetical protein
MDALPTEKDSDPAVSQTENFLCGARYREFLETVGDYEKCVAERRRHIVTYDDVDAIGEAGKKPLPITIGGKDGRPYSYKAVRLATGEIPKGRDVTVVLGIEADETFDPEALCVFISARKCTYLRDAAPKEQQYKDLRYCVYTLDNDGTLPPVSVIDMGLLNGRATIHWVEIEII